MPDTPDPAFGTPAELKALLGFLASRLHFLNRVSGESHFTWHLANLLSAAGSLTNLMKDADIKRDFGDGWTPGTLDGAAQTERMLSLLRTALRG